MRKFLAMLLILCMLTAMGCASAEDTVGMLEQRAGQRNDRLRIPCCDSMFRHEL